MLKQNAFFSLSVASLIAILVGCGGGSSNSTQSSNPTPTPVVSGSPTPTPGSGTQITCTPKSYADGVLLYYVGAEGSAFPTSNQPYIGLEVGTPFSNGLVEVNWQGSNVPPQNPSVTSYSMLMPQATCSTDITGWNVVYTGKVTANFPNANTVYLGKIVTIFAGGFAEIQWSNGPSFNTVEAFNSIAISQPAASPTPTPSH